MHSKPLVVTACSFGATGQLTACAGVLEHARSHPACNRAGGNPEKSGCDSALVLVDLVGIFLSGNMGSHCSHEECPCRLFYLWRHRKPRAFAAFRPGDQCRTRGRQGRRQLRLEAQVGRAKRALVE